MRTEDKKEIIELLRYKYLFIISLVISIGAAFIYAHLTSAKYQIKAKFYIKSAFKNNVCDSNEKWSSIMFDHFNTRAVAEKVIKDLNLQVRYFRKDRFESDEAYSNLSPLNITLKAPQLITQTVTFNVELIDSRHFKIIDGGKVYLGEFDQPLIFNNNEFTVIRNTRYKGNLSTIKVTIYSAAYINELYYENLIKQPLPCDSVGFSVNLTESNPDRASDFMDALISLYQKKSIYPDNDTGRTMESIDRKISAIKDSIKLFSSKNSNLKDSTIHLTDSEKKRLSQQVDILNVLEPYVKSPINQFALLPSTFEINDEGVTKLIKLFNALQQKKQSYLATSNSNDKGISTINTSLLNVQSQLITDINLHKKTIEQKLANTSSIQFVKSKKTESYPSAKLKGLTLQLQTQKNIYNYYLRKDPGLHQKQTLNVLKPHLMREASETKMIFLFAILIGLLMPLCLIYIFNLTKLIQVVK